MFCQVFVPVLGSVVHIPVNDHFDVSFWVKSCVFHWSGFFVVKSVTLRGTVSCKQSKGDPDFIWRVWQFIPGVGKRVTVVEAADSVIAHT